MAPEKEAIYAAAAALLPAVITDAAKAATKPLSTDELDALMVKAIKAAVRLREILDGSQYTGP